MVRGPRQQRRKINWPAATSLITALTAVGALIFTALSLNATRDQVRIAEQGQITDRYSRAIEQLGRQGPDQLQIRLGGIYALERLARDSARDQSTIIEVLTTFIRTSTPKMAWDQLSQRIGNECVSDSPQTPLSDVQAALTVLGRRDSANDNGAAIDLSHTCLRGARLRGAKLAHASFRESDLFNADFTNANLNSASFLRANLTKADFVNADLVGANLQGARLYDATLDRADFEGADLYFADLQFAEAQHANFSGANLSHIIASYADFSGANFTSAKIDDIIMHNLVITDDETKGWPYP